MTTKNYIIYKISCKDENIKDFYIGHTTNLNQRIVSHKTATTNETNRHYNYYIYKVIRENGGFDNWKVEELEHLNNIPKIVAREREEEIVKSLGATLNIYKAFRSKEDIKEYYGKNSKWYTENHERSKLRYKNICKKIFDLENENSELKAQLEAINSILKKNGNNF